MNGYIERWKEFFDKNALEAERERKDKIFLDHYRQNFGLFFIAHLFWMITYGTHLTWSPIAVVIIVLFIG